MQNDLVEMKADCKRQEEIVERAGRRVPYATDMINSLDNRCMSQLVDGEIVTLPESQPRREGNNDRYNYNRNDDNRDNNDRQRGRNNNRDNDRRGGSQRRGSRYWMPLQHYSVLNAMTMNSFKQTLMLNSIINFNVGFYH